MQFVPAALPLLFSVAFFCAWLLEHRRRDLILYALAFLTISAATVVQVAAWPADLGHNAVVSAVLYAAAPLFLVEGVLARSGKSMPVLAHVGWVAAFVGLLVYYYYVENDLQIRVYLLNFGMGCIFLHGAWLLRKLWRGSVVDRLMLVMLVFLALTFFGRTLVTGGSVPTDDVETFLDSDFWMWAQFTLTLVGVGMGLALLLIGGADVIQALKAERDRDPLTGMLNRCGLDARTNKIMAAARNQPLCVVACDIDRFKGINDRFGHSAGDAVLRIFAGVVRGNVRAGDVTARTGGEEFVILLPNTTVDEGYALIERLRGKVALMRPARPPDEFTVTCSFGIATLHDGEALWDAIDRADKILYTAKRAGRNRTLAEGLQLPNAA